MIWVLGCWACKTWVKRTCLGGLSLPLCWYYIRHTHYKERIRRNNLYISIWVILINTLTAHIINIIIVRRDILKARINKTLTHTSNRTLIHNIIFIVLLICEFRAQINIFICIFFFKYVFMVNQKHPIWKSTCHSIWGDQRFWQYHDILVGQWSYSYVLFLLSLVAF